MCRDSKMSPHTRGGISVRESISLASRDACRFPRRERLDSVRLAIAATDLTTVCEPQRVCTIESRNLSVGSMALPASRNSGRDAEKSKWRRVR